jgi:hypothetical protein
MWKKLYLEDLYDLTHLWPQFQTTTIDINATLSVESNKTPDEFYSQVVRNLKNALPNLEQVNLSGGYRFESSNEVCSIFGLMKARI